MKKRGKKNKKAQFYLIAAIIIVMMIVGLSSVTNYIISEKTPAKFYDLSEELNLESFEVVNHGIYQEKDINLLMETFTDDFTRYSEEKEKDVDLIFVYGDEENITIATYIKSESGEISVNAGGISFIIPGERIYDVKRQNFAPSGKEIEIGLLNKTYDFNIKKGENFVFIIKKEKEGEIHVTKSR